MDVQERAELLAASTFLGGPVKSFEAVGRNQLQVLLRHGLRPSSVVLDVGAGALRGGYWVMRVVDPGNYCAIEPNEKMLRAGIEHIMEPAVLAQARPRFDHNDRFDFSVFGVAFNFVIARSIWTHASKSQIETMLDSFVGSAAPDAVFLASVAPSAFGRDYRGETWVGRDHESGKPGIILHRRKWIKNACRKRGLSVTTTSPNILKQKWLAISAAK